MRCSVDAGEQQSVNRPWCQHSFTQCPHRHGTLDQLLERQDVGEKRSIADRPVKVDEMSYRSMGSFQRHLFVNGIPGYATISCVTQLSKPSHGRFETLPLDEQIDVTARS